MNAGNPTDIISMLYQNGVSITAALVCTGLYIRQLVAEGTNERSRTAKDQLSEERYREIVKQLGKIADSTQTIVDSNKSLLVNSLTLAELSKELSEDNHEMSTSLNILVQDLKVMAANQLNLNNSFQKVIEQLITALKDN